jgi:hypothetical protein
MRTFPLQEQLHFMLGTPASALSFVSQPEMEKSPLL